MPNPLSGHTIAGLTNTVDGLRDGDHILSASVTNPYEGIHGNGILLQSDGNAAHADRNAPQTLPGAVSVSGSNITIQGGYCVLDGVVYSFANGPGSQLTFGLNASGGTGQNGYKHDRTGAGSIALETGQEVLYTIYVCADGDTSGTGGGDTQNICYMQGTPVLTSTVSFADSPSAYLSDPHGDSLSNLQCVVLAVVRAAYNSGGGSDKITLTEGNDKRHFLNGGPLYLHPMKSVTTAASVDSVTDMNNLHGGGDAVGSLGETDFGALWLSHDAVTGGQNLYFSAKEAGGVATLSIVTGSAGTGYSAGSGVATAVGAGAGTGCTVTYTVSAGALTGVTGIPAAGANYQVGDILTVSGGGANAKLLVTSIAAARHTWRLGPSKVNLLSTATTANQTFTFDGYDVWIVNATGNLDLSPTGTFPPGHIVEVSNIGASHTITFDPSPGLNEAVANGKYGRFVHQSASVAASKVNTMQLSGFTTGTDRVTITVPTDAGGVGSAIQIQLCNDTDGSTSAGSGVIGVGTQGASASTVAEAVRDAINGVDSHGRVHFGSGTSAYGIAGLGAAIGGSATQVTITATVAGVAGNAITIANVAGSMATAGSLSGGLGAWRKLVVV